MTSPLEGIASIHGASDCAHSTDPLIQVHQFDDDTFVLRVSKCFSYEGNFIYLLFGDDRAVMFDTGGPPNPLTVNKCHFWPWIPANPAFPVRNSPPAPLVIVCMPPCLLEMMFAEPRIGRYLLQAS